MKSNAIFNCLKNVRQEIKDLYITELSKQYGEIGDIKAEIIANLIDAAKELITNPKIKKILYNKKILPKTTNSDAVVILGQFIQALYYSNVK